MSIFFKNIIQKNAIKNLKKYNSGDMPWAIVTGCTSGIGKSYSQILAQNNFNLILMSRNLEKLNILKEEIINENGSVKCEVVPLNFAENESYGKEKYSELFEKFKNLNIRLLVNNVGESSFAGNFFTCDINKTWSMCNVNMNSCVMLTHMFVKSISSNPNKETEKYNKDSYGIINVASYFGRKPVSGLTIYSSTKAFMIHFSKCLKYELEFEGKRTHRNIDLLCLTPLFVETKMSKLKDNFYTIKPETLVYYSFLRINKYTTFSNGSLCHLIQAMFLNLIPDPFFARATLKYYLNLQEKLKEVIKNRKSMKDKNN
jgi:short-subunit dehydrogenase